jgi:hypothetical protein
MNQKKTKAYPQSFIDYVATVRNKRARIVIDHIMRHGFITTEELEEDYGYSHPPRAARDVREAGIPLETFRVKSKEGKSIAAYRFGDISKLQTDRIAGRSSFPKTFKHELYLEQGSRCAICNGHFEERYLQIDHRTPYEVSGDGTDEADTTGYMLLCSSCNRAKSWSCEHCGNWNGDKDSKVCLQCYWGVPTNYTHIALKDVRRLDLLWEGNEVHTYDILNEQANLKSMNLPDFVKQAIGTLFNKNSEDTSER